MARPDYSARDKAVKHNVYASVRRRDGVSHEHFANYWRDVHSTLCSRLPGSGILRAAAFRPGRGRQSMADGRRRGSHQRGARRFGRTRVSPMQRIRRIFAEAGKILYEDEQNLFGEAIAYFLPTGSTTFVDREEDGQRNGPDRLHRVHVYMSRRPGSDAAQWLHDTSAELALARCHSKVETSFAANRMTTPIQRHPPPMSIIPSGPTGSIWPWPKWRSKTHALPGISLPAPLSGKVYRAQAKHIDADRCLSRIRLLHLRSRWRSNPSRHPRQPPSRTDRHARRSQPTDSGRSRTISSGLRSCATEGIRINLDIEYEHDLLAGGRRIRGRHRSVHDFGDPSRDFLRP